MRIEPKTLRGKNGTFFNGDKKQFSETPILVVRTRAELPILGDDFVHIIAHSMEYVNEESDGMQKLAWCWSFKEAKGSTVVGCSLELLIMT